MRHGDKLNNLGRTSAHRKALMRNLTCQLIQHKRITTTLAKAKSLRVFAEPLITRSKNDSMNNRRVVFSYLQDKEAIKELFGVIGDKVANRPGGYTRIIKLPRRLGDAADMALIELVDFNEIYNPKAAKETATKKTRRGRAKATTPKAEAAAAPATEETTAEETKTGDDLTLIEGIGPKAAEALVAAGIDSFATLAAKTTEEVKAILEAADGNFNLLDPGTWAQQAQLAADGKMDELKALQDELKGGKAEG